MHKYSATIKDLVNAKYAHVLGNPVKHSLSPILHNAAYKYLGLPYQYTAIETDTNGAKEIIAHLVEGEVFGLSITMPFKELAVALANDKTEYVKQSESANTLVLRDQKIVAENTDIYGITQSLKYKTPLDEEWGVIGTGATARSSIIALQELGVKRVSVIGRSAQKLSVLSNRYNINAFTFEDERLPKYLISTIPSDAQRENLNVVRDVKVLLDTTYHPWPSEFANEVIKGNGLVIHGVDMLVHQAVKQIEIMLGREVPAQVMFDALA